MHGREAELKLVERISQLEAQHMALLKQLPDHLQAHYWRRHKEASIGQGSERWVFPPLIYDEEAFRRRVQQQEEAEQAGSPGRGASGSGSGSGGRPAAAVVESASC